jgi:hypothetical protein
MLRETEARARAFAEASQEGSREFSSAWVRIAKLFEDLVAGAQGALQRPIRKVS